MPVTVAVSRVATVGMSRNLNRKYSAGTTIANAAASDVPSSETSSSVPVFTDSAASASGLSQ